MEKNNELLENIKEAIATFEETGKKLEPMNVTTLKKIEEIKILTGLDLIVLADDICKKAIGSIQSGNSEMQYMTTILGELANFIGEKANIDELTAEGKTTEAVELINSITERNDIIYRVLFGEEPSYADLTPRKARAKQNEVFMKILEQLTILINEATQMSFEALLETTKKQMES